MNWVYRLGVAGLSFATFSCGVALNPKGVGSSGGDGGAGFIGDGFHPFVLISEILNSNSGTNGYRGKAVDVRGDRYLYTTEFNGGELAIWERNSDGVLALSGLFGEGYCNECGGELYTAIFDEDGIPLNNVDQNGNPLGGADPFGFSKPPGSKYTMGFSGAFIDENTAAVSYYDILNPQGQAKGMVFVVRRMLGSWFHTETLRECPDTPGNRFGFTVGGSNGTLLVSAHGTNNGAGSLHVYRESGGSFPECPSETLNISDFSSQIDLSGTKADDARFGSFFDYESSSGTLVVGAMALDDVVTGADRVGAAFVYDRVGSSFTPRQVLRASNGFEADRFGMAMKVVGSSIFVSAPFVDFLFQDTGSIYHFKKGSDQQWYESKIIRPPTNYYGLGAQTGKSLDYCDGTLVLGAPHAVTPVYTDGRVFLYTEEDDGDYSLAQVLDSSSPANGGRFGASVACDGGNLIVGGLYSGPYSVPNPVFGYAQHNGLVNIFETK